MLFRHFVVALCVFSHCSYSEGQTYEECKSKASNNREVTDNCDPKYMVSPASDTIKECKEKISKFYECAVGKEPACKKEQLQTALKGECPDDITDNEKNMLSNCAANLFKNGDPKDCGKDKMLSGPADEEYCKRNPSFVKCMVETKKVEECKDALSVVEKRCPSTKTGSKGDTNLATRSVLIEKQKTFVSLFLWIFSFAIPLF